MSDFCERRVYDLAAQIRDVDDAGKRVLVGMAAPYDEEAAIGNLYIEVLAPGVFKRSIKHLSDGGKSLPLHMFHDTKTWPVGKSTDWEDTQRGLIGTWEFAVNDEVSERAWQMARDDFINGLSVGFQPIRSDIRPGSDTRPPYVVRQEARLFETSLVSAGAYPSAQVMLVRTAGLTVPKPHVERWRQWRDEYAGA